MASRNLTPNPFPRGKGNNRAEFCALLRTKTAYYRNPDGERMFDPESSTACYTCLKTQRPVGPDGLPVDAQSCGAGRGCFEQEG